MLPEQYLDLQPYEPSPDDIQEMREIEEEAQQLYYYQQLSDEDRLTIRQQLDEAKAILNHAKSVFKRRDAWQLAYEPF